MHDICDIGPRDAVKGEVVGTKLDVQLFCLLDRFDDRYQGFYKEEINGLCEQAGFEVVESRRYGVLAYLFGGFPDHFGVLKYVPGSAGILRWMLKVDRFLVNTRFLRVFAFQVMVAARPKR